MKKETYNVPAYKFGVVKMVNDETKSYSREDYITALKQQKAVIIPFEYVDGLTCKEIKELLRVEEIMFCSYCQYSGDSLDGAITKVGIGTEIMLYINSSQLQTNDSIDQIIARDLEANYKYASSLTQAHARCFFERYQDQDYQKTKIRIETLN